MKICAFVVLAQLAPTHGFQIKWALDFPGAPLGAIEYTLTHVIKKLGEVGVRSATFGAGATDKLERADNVGGFRVMTLEKVYNGLNHAFPSFSNKSDFRAKFGVHPEPVSLLLIFKSGSGDSSCDSAVYLFPQGRHGNEGHRVADDGTAAT